MSEYQKFLHLNTFSFYNFSIKLNYVSTKET